MQHSGTGLRGFLNSENTKEGRECGTAETSEGLLLYSAKAEQEPGIALSGLSWEHASWTVHIVLLLWEYLEVTVKGPRNGGSR